MTLKVKQTKTNIGLEIIVSAKDGEIEVDFFSRLPIEKTLEESQVLELFRVRPDLWSINL
jgi:hypothetical protein